MTDDAIEQIPEPTPAEARALAVLDARGRSAAASLTAAVSAHVESAKVDQKGSPAEPVPPRTGAPDGADDVPLVVDLSAGRTRPSRASARPWWLAAAAVAAVVGLVAVVTSQDDGRSVMSSGGGEYLVAGWLPDGVAPVGAVDLAAMMGARERSPEIVVYGDAGTADPWAGPTISVVFVAAPAEELPGDLRQDQETIDVGDSRATLVTTGGLVVVERAVAGGTLAVVGDDEVTQGEVVVAAAAATVDPAVAGAALPEGFAEIARGPLSAAGSSIRALYGFDGDELGLVYQRGEGAQGDPSLAVFQRPGSEAAVDLARLHQDTSTVTEIRGERAVVSTSSDPDVGEDALQWLEPSGMLVTVVGTGIAPDDLVRVAEDLRPAAAGEIATLREQYEQKLGPVESGDGAATELPLEDGQTEVAAGEHEGEPWRLLATRRPGYAALELAYGNGSAGTGWDTGIPGPLEVSWSSSGGWPGSAVFGVVAEGATVTIEVPGRSPVSPDLVALPGWDHQGFVAFLPDLNMPDLDMAEVVVVARGADGQEIARDSQPLMDPPVLEDGLPPAVPEEGSPG